MIAPAGLVPAGVFCGGSKTFSGSVTYIYEEGKHEIWRIGL